MSEQEIEGTTIDESPAVVAPGGVPREDDRNEEVDGSPVPDSTADDTGADDVPDAD